MYFQKIRVFFLVQLLDIERNKCFFRTGYCFWQVQGVAKAKEYFQLLNYVFVIRYV